MPRHPPTSWRGRLVLHGRFRADVGVVGARSLLARLAVPRVRRVMTDGAAIPERRVRRYPEQWVWAHARLLP